MVAALRPPDIDAIITARENGQFHSLLDFCARVTISRDSIENLILSGVFDLIHEHRRGLLWRLDETLAKARALKSEAENRGNRLDIRFAGDYETPISWDIADLNEWDTLMWEWRTTGVTSSCHPFAHLRERLTPRGILSAHDAMHQRPGTRVQVAGLNICPHRPPSKSGGRHLFLTLEDESAYMQVSFRPEAIEQNLGPVLMSPVVIITGTIHRRGVASYLFADDAQPLPMKREALESSAEMLVDPPRRPAAAM
jgi:error-prone DNA polymerase